MVGVVILEHVRHGLSCRGKALNRAAVREAARGVRRAVRAVRADGEYDDVFCPRDLRGGSERELLVAPALAVPGEPDDRFAAEDKGPRRAAGRVLPRERAEARADLAGDALLTVGKNFRRIPKIAAGFLPRRRTARGRCR